MTHTQHTAWQAMQVAATDIQNTNLTNLFAQDTHRFARFSRQIDGLLFDFSRELLDEVALDALLSLAHACDVIDKRDALFAGEPINATEGRQVLHPILRADAHDASCDATLLQEVQSAKARFLAFADEVRSGSYSSISGAPFTDVVHIGIGGSDLGPRMVTKALTPLCDGPAIHFVANVDSADLVDCLAPLVPETTLVIVSSKTFRTTETRQNYNSARHWLTRGLGQNAAKHLVAVTSNPAGAAEVGIDAERTFTYWDWVGGRYSVWSAVGLPIALAVGSQAFEAFLAGGRMMDKHFQTAPLAENIPVLAALIGIWRHNVLRCDAVALIPYAERLSLLPAYLQQLDMESNGKSVTMNGARTATHTAPVLFGEAGTCAQHSFFQMFHQGTMTVPVDFIVSARTLRGESLDASIHTAAHHDMLVCNALAQATALAFGRSEQTVRAEMQQAGAEQTQRDALAPHRVCQGNRPSSVFACQVIDPMTLGCLVALFEHKVATQGFIWGINSFDQWGVELGKGLAEKLLIAFQDKNNTLTGFDGATQGLASYLRRL